MAQVIHSRFICDGLFRIHAIDGIGKRKPRIIEVEVVDTGERHHGSARRLESLVRELAVRTWASPQRLHDRS